MTFTGTLKVFALATALGVAGLANSAPATAQSVVQKILQRGTLRVGMSSFVPWAMRNKEGKLIGFEIDVAKKVAADMGVKVEFVPTAWSGIIPSLLAKKFDVIIGGMSITPQRNLTVNFTIPYEHSGQQLLANSQLTSKFKSLKDYNASDVTITCRRATPACHTAETMFPKATIRRFDDDAQAFQEVVNGNAYGTVMSAPKPEFWAHEHPDKVYVADNGKYLTHGDEAFALRKGDVDALNFFSNWILVNTSNGWLQKTHDFWFKDRSNWADQVNK